MGTNWDNKNKLDFYWIPHQKMNPMGAYWLTSLAACDFYAYLYSLTFLA
jgi:hypothetical protein